MIIKNSENKIYELEDLRKDRKNSIDFYCYEEYKIMIEDLKFDINFIIKNIDLNSDSFI